MGAVMLRMGGACPQVSGGRHRVSHPQSASVPWPCSSRPLLSSHFFPSCHISGLDQGSESQVILPAVSYKKADWKDKRLMSEDIQMLTSAVNPVTTSTELGTVSNCYQAKVSDALNNKAIQRVLCGELATML